LAEDGRPVGRDSPSPIGPLLIWQQPHRSISPSCAIARIRTTRTVKRFADVVQATAEFMASYAWFNEKTGRYDLGPPVIPAQENHPVRETWNPTYELAYWRFGLRIANEWRRRSKLKAEPAWDRIIEKLAPLPAEGRRLPRPRKLPADVHRAQPRSPVDAGRAGCAADERRRRDVETMRRTLKKVLPSGAGTTRGAGTIRWPR
jgi:hypothetical protein